MKPAIAFLALFLAAAPAMAAYDESLPDPAQEARARNLQRELRCVVCQGQSIDESNAELAMDLRRLIREKILAGESDEAIRNFMVTRYGAFILMKPPLRSDTFALWFLPALLVFAGAGVVSFIVIRARRRASAEPPEPSDLEVAP